MVDPISRKDFRGFLVKWQETLASNNECGGRAADLMAQVIKALDEYPSAAPEPDGEQPTKKTAQQPRPKYRQKDVISTLRAHGGALRFARLCDEMPGTYLEYMDFGIFLDDMVTKGRIKRNEYGEYCLNEWEDPDNG